MRITLRCPHCGSHDPMSVPLKLELTRTVIDGPATPSQASIRPLPTACPLRSIVCFQFVATFAGTTMDAACPKQVCLGGFDVNEYLPFHLVSLVPRQVLVSRWPCPSSGLSGQRFNLQDDEQATQWTSLSPFTNVAIVTALTVSMRPTTTDDTHGNQAHG